MASNGHWLTDLVRDIDDFPTPGVTFRDITPLLGDGEGFARAINELACRFDDVQVDRVLGMEARGFIIAAPVAYRMGAGFVPVRKAGKLPWAVVREEYSLEYGQRQAGDPPRRHPSRRADPGDRRRAGHRRHGGGDGSARRGARRASCWASAS